MNNAFETQLIELKEALELTYIYLSHVNDGEMKEHGLSGASWLLPEPG